MLQIFKHMKARAGDMACNTALYNWSLSGPVPERLCVHPVDSWAGCADAGRMLCDGALFFEGAQVPLCEHGWHANEQDWRDQAGFLNYMHGFSWLRDLRALSSEKGMGAVARTQAKMMIRGWIHHYERWHAQSWRSDLIGERLSMWLSSYEFFSAVEFFDPGEEEAFQDMFFESCIRQVRHLSRVIQSDKAQDLNARDGLGAFYAAKGLLYAGAAFEDGEVWLEQALHCFERDIDRQILGDGGHVSRSPARLLEVLRILLDVRIVLQGAGIPCPEKIQHAIDKMGPALRFFQYNDKGLALFHGSQEGDAECTAALLRQAGVRGKVLSALPCTGYERVTLGRTSLLMDVGAPPPKPFDKGAHASPLSFELCYGRERLFVNCGSHPFDHDWQDALRATAAHSAVGLDHRNACEIKKSGHIARSYSAPKVIREDLKTAALIEASHDAYAPLNGFTHKRRIYISEQGEDIRGEDVLSAENVPSDGAHAAVRFHLHPRVMVSLIRDGQEALLRLPGGVGWRFHHQGGMLALEDSVYLGQGSIPRKAKQLAIYGQITDLKAQIKWALQKEG